MDKYLDTFKITFPYWEDYNFKVGNVVQINKDIKKLHTNIECKYDSFVIAAITQAYSDGNDDFTVEGLCKEVK